MTFIVEDCTGIPNSTSYVDIVYADAYCAAQGYSDWAQLTQAAKENALNDGSSYADQKWGAKLGGRPLNNEQALEYPRSGLYDRYYRPVLGIPDNWKKSVCEYAFLSATNALHATVATQEAYNIKSKKTVVGPITTETSYREGNVSRVQFIDFPKADALVYPYTNAGISGVGRTYR